MINMTSAGGRLAVLSIVFCLASLAWSQSCSDFAVSYQLSYEAESIEASSGDAEYCSSPTDGQCCPCSQEIYICDGLDAALRDVEHKRVNGSQIQYSVSLYKSEGELVLDLNSNYTLCHLDMVQIQAIGDVTVNCNNRAGIVFNAITQVSVSGINWYGCGTSAIPTLSITSEYIGGLIFLSCTNVSINSVTFEKSRGSGLLIGLSPLLGADNTTYVYQITSSHFRSNAMSPEYGGGVFVHVDTLQHQPMFLFEDCMFFNNSADFGGGVYIEGPRIVNDECTTEPHVTFKNCSFNNNSAAMTGGAVFVKSYTTMFTDQCRFINNSARISAAALSVDLTDLFSPCPSNVTTINSCHFEGNRAQESSAVMIVNIRRQKNYSVVLKNTRFSSNSVNRLLYGSEATSCAVHVERVLTYVIDTDFLNSFGAGICMANANVTVGGNVSFANNSGYFGGGMFLADDSVIFFSHRSNLSFINNSAIYGGGITGWSPANSTCIFSFSNNVPLSTVWFVNNTARIAGNSIYINSPSEYCKQTDFEDRNFNFVPNTTMGNIASGVQQVQVLQNVLNIIPGQNISIDAEVLDFYRNPSSAQISAYLTKSQNEYSLNGLSEFSIENGTTLSSLYVTGPNQESEDVTLNLVATTDTALNFRVTNNITLNIRNCSLGFSYYDSEGRCQCTTASLDVVPCDIGRGQACVKRKYWVGVENNKVFYTQCTSSSCEKINSTCNKCNISNDVDEYCDITGLPSFQCPDNRAGRICAYCAQNHSFSYAAVNCVPNEGCTGASMVIVPFLVIIFLVIIVCLLILFLKLDYQISTGYMFSFIYYFSIVDYFLPARIHSNKALIILVSVFESITQLNPQFLAYVGLCVPQELSALWHQALLYLTPLVISMVVVIFILITKVCSRYIRFSDSTPVRAICLLLLLSFTAFNESSISILGFVQFTGLNGSFVAIQPSTVYFDKKDHLGLFILAVAIEVFLIIPFTLFLFLTPFLVRCINFNKLKPFLDEFQGCYKDKFRWMAAFYFFCRQVYLFLIILLNFNESLTAYILQFTSLFILVFHMLLRPYREDWLNLVDTVFLADLLCISLLYGETAEVVFASRPGGAITRMVFTYILVLIPIIYFICVVVVALFRKFPKATEKILNVILCKYCCAKPLDEDDPDFVSSYTHIRTPSQESVRNFREPLLSDAFEESERSSGRRSRRSTRNIPFIHRRDRSRQTASYSIVEAPAALVESNESKLIRSGRSSSQTWQEEGTAAGTQETVDNEEL